MPPLAWIALGLMVLGNLGPAGSARTREAALRAQTQMLGAALNFKLGQQRLELQKKALELEFLKAKLQYDAFIKLGQRKDADVRELIEELKRQAQQQSAQVQQESQTKTSPQAAQPGLQPVQMPNPQGEEQESSIQSLEDLAKMTQFNEIGQIILRSEEQTENLISGFFRFWLNSRQPQKPNKEFNPFVFEEGEIPIISAP